MSEATVQIKQTQAKHGTSFPLAIALFGMVTVLLYGGYRAITAANGELAWVMLGVVVVYAMWIASELRITASELGREATTDRGTCESYAIARGLTMLAALAFDPMWTELNAWVVFGCAVFLAGIALRGFAIYTLGKNYSHRVRHPQAKNSGDAKADAISEPVYDIVSNGPYRFVRHPAYSGMVLAHVGIVIVFFNWFVLLALSAIFLPALIRRIRVEEAHLLDIPAYRNFATGRARLVPGVW
jgi:protein-S-isoprenylcysteine O-methyltransferase Ste14